MSTFPEILILVRKKIFCFLFDFKWNLNSCGFALYRNLIFSLLTLYFVRGNIFVQSWLFEQVILLCSKSSKVLLAKFWSEKMFSQNTFQKCSRSLFFKIGAFINFPKFTRKYLCWSPFVIKPQVWWPSILLTKRPHRRCFPVKITKCLTIAFLWSISGGCFWKWLKYLYRRIYKRDRFVKTCCSKWSHEIEVTFLYLIEEMK